ncbi:hypothetical protein, variant [Verruconis gallopava]|nr:hypothetical protein, variant [Verruconis gallopava]KIV98332.1 hypothetical protein, variant [Verruconis gallopava]
MLLSWVLRQSFAQNCRSSLVIIGLDERNGAMKKLLKYYPWNVKLLFWYKNNLIFLRHVDKRSQAPWFRTPEEISLSCFGWSPQILKDLLEECRRNYLVELQGQTVVFEVKDGKWQLSATRGHRPMSTVLLNAEIKNALLADITRFLGQKTREWYNKRGILYKRGYLLYGPPGTGKSSLSFSIAGHFDLDIYILNLASITDEILASLFENLPQQCIVLLEDVDVATTNRFIDRESTHFDPSANLEEKKSLGVTLSGLLNALDGVGSQEGRLLIMTTNYPDRLDYALIRPGRIDLKIELPLAEKAIINELFHIVFKDTKSDEVIERLGNEFTSLMPESEFSPAEVLSLLLEHRDSPESAIAGVEAWVARIREERQKKLKREFLGCMGSRYGAKS